MSEIHGSFVTEIDGVRFYTDGYQMSGNSFSARVGVYSFSAVNDSISDTWDTSLKLTTAFPIVNCRFARQCSHRCEQKHF